MPRPLARRSDLAAILALGVGAGLVGACSAPDAGAPAPTASQTASQTDADASPPAPATSSGEPASGAAKAPAEALAYVSVARAGVFRIDERGWSFAASSRAPIRDLDEVAGTLHVLTSFGVHAAPSLRELTPVATVDKLGYEQIGEPVAMAGDGRRFWMVGAEGLGAWDGSAWTFTSAATLAGTGALTNQSLAVDADGRAWLGWGRLQRSGPDGWAPVADAPAHAVVASADHRTLLVHAGCTGPADAGAPSTCALVRYRDAEPTRFEVDAGPCADLPALALSPDGERAALVGGCGLVRLELGQPGGAAQLRTHADGGWIGVEPTAAAIDDGGRVWVGIGHGFAVVDAGPAGAVERYPLAQLTDISGTVDALVVTGAGPTPPTLGELRRGGLRATLVTREAPIAEAPVELCSRAEALDASGVRCRPEAVVARARTDADGQLVADDLPLDDYHVSVEVDGRWRLAAAKPATMRAGMAGNVGKLVVEPGR